MGQYPVGYEEITVSSTAVGFTDDEYGAAKTALVQVDGAPIRVREDGTAPTATVGREYYPGDAFYVRGDLSYFKAIRLSAADATLRVTYQSVTPHDGAVIEELGGAVTMERGPSAKREITIALNGSLSEPIDCRGMLVSAIIMPDVWTAAGLAIRLCGTEDGTYAPYHYDNAGTKTRVQVIEGGVVAAGESYHFPWRGMVSGCFMKLESVNPSTLEAVAQEAARTIEILMG